MSTINYLSVPMGNGEKKGLTWAAVQNLINNLRLPHPDSELAVQIRKEIPMTKHLYERFYEKPWLYYQIIQSYALYTAGNQSVCSFGVKYKKIPFEVRMRMDPKDAWPKLQPPTPQQWFDKERADALMAIMDLNKENALQKEDLQMDDQLQELFDLATRKYRGQLDQAGSWIGDASQELAKYCSRIKHKSQERQNLIARLLRHNRRIIEAHAISPMAALVEYHGHNETFAVRLAEVFRQYVKRLEEIENELNFLLASDEMGDKKQLRAQLALSMRQVIQLRRANSGFEENRYNLGLENQQLKSQNQQQRSRIKYLEAKAIDFARWQRWTNEKAKKAQAELQASMEADHNRKVGELESANIKLTSMCHEVERDNDLLRTEGGTIQEVAQLKRQLEAYRRDNEELKKQRHEARADADNQTKRNEIARRENLNLEKNADIHKKEMEKLQKQNADLMRALQQGQTAEVMHHRDHAGRDKSQLAILPPHNEASHDHAGSNDGPQTPGTPSSTSSDSSAVSDKTFNFDECNDRVVERAVVTANLSLSEGKTDVIESLGWKFNQLRWWKKTHEDDNKKLRILHEEEFFAKQSEIDSLRANIRELETPSTPSSTSSDKTFDLDDCIDKIEEEAATTADVSLSELKNFEIETLGEKCNELRAWKKAHKDDNNKLRQWHKEELLAKQSEIDSLVANVRELESRPSVPNEQIKKLAAAEAVSNENAILRLSLADEKAQRVAAEDSFDALAESLERQLQAKDDFYGAPGCFRAYRLLEAKCNDLGASRIELWDDNDALRMTLRELDPDTGLAHVALSKLRQLKHLGSKLSEEDVEKVKDLEDTLVSLTDGFRSKLRNLDLGSRMPGGLGAKLKDYDLTFKLPNGLSKQGWLLHRVHMELLMSKIGTLEGTIDDLGRVVQGKEAIIDMIPDRWKALGMEEGSQRWQEFEEIAHRLANTEEVFRRMKAMLAQQTEALAEAQAAVWATQDLQARVDELEEELASQHHNAGNTDDDDELPRGRSPTPTPCINGLWGGFGGNVSELQESVRCLGNELADVNSRFDGVIAENSTLKSDMAQREWWIGQLQEEAVRRERHTSDLRDADFEKEAQEFGMRIAKLEYRNAELEDELRSQHLNDDGDLTELQHTVSRQNSEFTQAYLRLNDANATSSRLRGIIELRDAFIRGAEIEHEKELEELRETISDQRRDLAQAYSSADGLKTIISDLRGTATQRDVDNDELEATNSGLRQAIADLKDEIQELNIRIQSLKRESKEMEDHFFNAQSARDILDVENYRIQKLRKEVVRLQNEKEGVEKENGEVVELCNGRTRQLNVTMDKYNKAKIMLHCTTKEVKALKSKLEAAESAAADGLDESTFFREEHRRTSMLSAARRGSNLMSDSPHTPSMHPRVHAQRNGSPGPRSGGLRERTDSMSSMIAHFMPTSSPGGRMFQPSTPRASSPPARPSMRGKPSYAKSAALNSSLSRHAGQVLRSQLDTARSSHLPLSECSPGEAEKRLKAMHGTELMEAASLVEEPPVLSSPPRQIQRDHTAEVARIKALMGPRPVVKSGPMQKEARLQTQPAAETSASFSEREIVKASDGIWERPVFVRGEAHAHNEASIEMCTPLPSPELPKDEEAVVAQPVNPSTIDGNAANGERMKKTASSLSLLSSNRLSKRLSRGFLKATATASTTMENIAGFVGNAMTKSKSKSEMKELSAEDGASFEVSKQPASRKGLEISRELPVNDSAATAALGNVYNVDTSKDVENGTVKSESQQKEMSPSYVPRSMRHSVDNPRRVVSGGTSRAASGTPSTSAEKTQDVDEIGTAKSSTGEKEAWWSGDKPVEPSKQPSSNKLRKVASGLPVPIASAHTPSAVVETPADVESGTARPPTDKAAEIPKKPAPARLQTVESGLPLRAASGEASPAIVKTVVSVQGDDKTHPVSVSSIAATASSTEARAGLRKVGTVGDLKAPQSLASSLDEGAPTTAPSVFRKIGTVGDLRARQTSAPSPTEPSKLRGFPSLSNIRENPFMKADPKRASSASSGSPVITAGRGTPSEENSKRVTSGGSVKDRAAAFMDVGKENSPALKSPWIDSRRAVSESTAVGKLDTAPEFADKLRAIHVPRLSSFSTVSTREASKSPSIDSNGGKSVSQTADTSAGKLKPNLDFADKLRAIGAPKLPPSSSIHTPKSPVDSPNAPKLSFAGSVDALKSPRTSAAAQGSELIVNKLRAKTSASRLPLAISGNRGISAALKSAPLKPSKLANSFRFPSDTSLASLSGKQLSEPKQTKTPSGSSLGVGPTTLEGNPVRQKVSAERTNETLSDTSQETTTTTPAQTLVVPRKPTRLPLKFATQSNSSQKASSSQYTVTRSSTPTARPATPRKVTPTAAARPSARRPTPQLESRMPTQPQPGTKQHQEALFGQTFAPTSDAVAPNHRSSVYSEVMPSSPPIMAQYDGWGASSDYEEEAGNTMVAPNHNQDITTINNTIPTAGLRPNQAVGKINPRGASAGFVYAFSNTPAVSGQPPSSDGIAPRHPVITPSGLRRPISIGAAATLYSAASSSPHPPALPGRDLDSLPSQRNRSAPPPVELARHPAISDRASSQRGRPLPPQPQREQREQPRPVQRFEDPFITLGIKNRAQRAHARPAEYPYGHQGNISQHPKGRPAVGDEGDPYMSHGQRALPPPQEYRQFEGNPFATQEVKSKDKGKDKGKAVAENKNDPVYPSSPPRAQPQLGQLANNQFIHRESSGLPQNGQNPFVHHRNPARGPVVDGVQYPPWDDVKGPLNDNPFTDNSRLAPAVAPPNPPRRQPSQRECPQYGLPMIPRPLNADPFSDRSQFAPAVATAVAPAVAPPRRNLSNRERQQYILPRTRQGLQNQRYEPPHELAPNRPADENPPPHPHRPVSDGDSLFNFLLEDVRKPSSSTPTPTAQTPVPRHPIQQPPASRPAPKPQTPIPRAEIVQQQQPSSQDRFGQRFGERFEQFDRTFNDDDIPNNLPNWDDANTWAVPDPNVRIEGPDPSRFKQQQQPGEQKERGWKKMFSLIERAASNPAPMAMGGPSGGSSEQRGGGSRLASFGQGLRDFGRSTSNVFRRGRGDNFTPASPPTRPPNRWGRQLLADLNASARRLFGRGDPPLSRPLAETRNPPSHGLTGGEHGMRGRRSSARSLHTRGSKVFSPVDFGCSSPPRSDSSRLDSDPPRRHPLAEGLLGIGTAEYNRRRRNSALGREEKESDWVDESGVGYDEDEISIEYEFGDREWAVKEGKKRGRRFSQ